MSGGAEYSQPTESGVVDPEQQMRYARLAADYGETQGAMSFYVRQNANHLLQLSDTEWILAAALPTEEEYGAQEGDVGLRLVIQGTFHPKYRTNAYTLELHHVRADESEPTEPETTAYPARPEMSDLDEYSEEIAVEWFQLIFAATANGWFKKREAQFSIPGDHPSKKVTTAMRSYEVARAAFATWLEGQSFGTAPEAGGEPEAA